MKKYDLQDVKEPSLFKDTFPYSIPPLIRFEGPLKETIDGKEVEIDPATVAGRDIHITDTTFRDGQQSRPPYSADQTVKIFEMLSVLGGDEGVIRQSEFFLYTSQDREKIERCKALGLRFPEVTGWIRPSIGELRSLSSSVWRSASFCAVPPTVTSPLRLYRQV